jgi:Protein of unknown function (DUF4238)
VTNRRQHTNPQFYLRPFLSPGFVYKRGANEPLRTNHPGNVAVRRDYYGREDEGAISLDAVNRKLEEDGAPALRNLIEDPGIITADDWDNLSWLFANLWMRTPAAIDDMLTDLRQTYREIRAIVEPAARKSEEGKIDLPEAGDFFKHDNSVAMTLEELRETENALTAKEAHLISATSSFKLLPDVAACIQQMHFLLIQAPKGHYFVTSDRPLILRSGITDSRVGAGWENRDAIGSIPLCPTTLLMMLYHEARSISLASATAEQVAYLNRDTMRFASNEVYSCVESPSAYEWMKGFRSKL